MVIGSYKEQLFYVTDRATESITGQNNSKQTLHNWTFSNLAYHVFMALKWTLNEQL